MLYPYLVPRPHHTLLHALPLHPSLQACLRRLLSPAQTRDDIIRRSSGLPFALTALFLAEPGNAPKALLPRGMAALLDAAGAATCPCLRLPGQPGGEGEAGAGAEGQEEGKESAVVVVEGVAVRQVWPVVHAFNCLRHAFNDRHLSVDTSGYFAPAIQVC